MEAICTLIRGDLPPVGRRIVHLKVPHEQPLPEFSGYFSSWVDSGTSALALAFLQARSMRPEIMTPEVILPGYCCPDLVAAAHYAGLIPRVVDINPNDPSLNIEAVRSYITENTIALVAINFLGLAENLTELLKIKSDFPQVFIVEDNAQWFPQSDNSNLLAGDFVTFSFGRGKPVSMLGGGLLLSKTPVVPEFYRKHVKEIPVTGGFALAKLSAKYFAYNQLLRPFLYQFLSRNPFITLGRTQYHSLKSIDALDACRDKLLAANIVDFQQAHSSIEKQYDAIFSAIGFENQLCAMSSTRRRRLLRYPVLFSTRDQKQKVFSRLIALGLGATEMYRSNLLEVEGVNNVQVCGRLESASSFASRLITLPVHTGVTEKHLLLVRDAFQS